MGTVSPHCTTDLVLRAARGKHRASDVARALLDPAPMLDALRAELDAGAYHYCPEFGPDRPEQPPSPPFPRGAWEGCRAQETPTNLPPPHRGGGLGWGQLSRDLGQECYRPGVGRAFWIREPKRRRIFALPFRDRVVQHLLIDATLPALERWYAPQSYACRVGKGSHRCLRRAIELARAKRFVLRVDVRKFFPSIDHAILRALLAPRTPPAWRWLRDVFLDAPIECERVAWHFPGDDLFTPLARPHGLPIGSLTSQIWANAYLTPIDHLLGSKLGLGTFVRYCDDLLVFDDDAGRLRDALAAIEARAHALRLRLHPEKTRLHRTSDRVGFLGFVLQRRGDGVSVRLRSENPRRFRLRMKSARALFQAGAI